MPRFQFGKTSWSNNPEPSSSPGQTVEEKRAKREIANMNERRRMQNINAGFHSLRSLLPQKHNGEKLSKAAILQHTANYIYQLEQEINKLISQNNKLKDLAGNSDAVQMIEGQISEWARNFAQPPDCPSCKRRKFDENNHHLASDLRDSSSPLNGDGSSTESSSEQELNNSNNHVNKSSKSHQNANRNSSTQNKSRLPDSAGLRKQLNRLQKELEDERRMRLILEEELQYQGRTSKSISSSNGRTGLITNIGRNQPMHVEQVPQNIDEVEIASESLEFEMQSCPASPREIVLVPETTGHSLQYNTGSQILNEQKHHLMDQQQITTTKQQNAIALPIDVPFVSPNDDQPMTSVANSNEKPVQIVFVKVNENNIVVNQQAVSNNNRNTNNLQKTSSASSKNSASITTSNSSTPSTNKITASGQPHVVNLVSANSPNKKSGQPTILTTRLIADGQIVIKANNSSGSEDSKDHQASKTSRQNLNTIVEAIRHLEGDHLFHEKNGKITKKEIKEELNEESVIKTKQTKTDDTNKPNDEKKPKVINVTSATARPQIIQITRPNVIVANSLDN